MSTIRKSFLYIGMMDMKYNHFYQLIRQVFWKNPNEQGRTCSVIRRTEQSVLRYPLPLKLMTYSDCMDHVGPTDHPS